MKFIQLLLCLVVFTSLFLEISAIQTNLIRRKKKASKKVKGIIDWLLGRWNNIALEITDAQNHKQTFNGEMNFVYFDKSGEQPFGFEVKGLVQSGKGADTGFIKNVLSYETVNQEGGKQPCLDLRLVKDCSFADNAKDYFGDWTIYFDMVGQDTYQQQSSALQVYGNNWKVSLVLKADGKDRAMAAKNSLLAFCITRSKQMNVLKQNAISAGDKYYTLYDLQVKQAQSLSQKVDLGATQQAVLNSVQSEQTLKAAAVQTQINANSKALADANLALAATQTQAQGAQQDVEAQNKALEVVKSQLSVVQQSQSAINAQILGTKSQLNEAVNLQASQNAAKSQLVVDKTKIDAQATAEKAELDRLVKAQQDSMTALKAQYDAQQALLATQQAAIQAASQAKQTGLTQQAQANLNEQQKADLALQQTQAQVESLLASVSTQQQQAQLIDEQRSQTEKSVAQMQNLLEQKRNSVDQLNSKQSMQDAFQQTQDKNLAAAKASGDKLLADLAAKQQAELGKLNQANENVKLAQAAASKAATDVSAAYLLFNNAINAINNSAKQAQGRTQLALENVSQNKHGQHLLAIQSNSGANIKRRMQRLARQKKDIKRLAKLIKTQVRKVRLQRKRKDGKKSKKQLKKQHKKQE